MLLVQGPHLQTTVIGRNRLRRVRERIAVHVVTEALSGERIARLRPEDEELWNISETVFQAEARAYVQNQGSFDLHICWEEASEGWKVLRKNMIKGDIGGGLSLCWCQTSRLWEGVWILPQCSGKPTRIMRREGMRCSSCFKDITLLKGEEIWS